MQNDIREMRIVNWREVVQDRDGWRGATGEETVNWREVVQDRGGRRGDC